MKIERKHILCESIWNSFQSTQRRIVFHLRLTVATPISNGNIVACFAGIYTIATTITDVCTPSALACLESQTAAVTNISTVVSTCDHSVARTISHQVTLILTGFNPIARVHANGSLGSQTRISSAAGRVRTRSSPYILGPPKDGTTFARGIALVIALGDSIIKTGTAFGTIARVVPDLDTVQIGTRVCR